MNKNMKKTVNMFQNIKAAPTSTKAVSFGFVAAITLILIALGIGGGYFLITAHGNSLDTQILEAEQYTANHTLETQEMNEIQARISSYAQYDDAVQSAYAALSSPAQFDTDIYSILVALKPDRVTFTGLSLGGTTLTIECKTSDNLPPADFVQALDQSNYFLTVGYPGFQGIPEEGYIFSVTCVLPKGGSGE